MKVVNTTTRETIDLADTPFAKGGEGGLYKVLAPNKYKGLVAKIYHLQKRTKKRAYKLRYLIKKPPRFENAAQASLVAWPKVIIERENHFVGFLMPMAQGELLEVLASAKIPRKLLAEWERFNLKNKEALQLRQKVCFNIAVAIYNIHATGHYVMVDLKPENILIQPNGLISLVDMDSIEIVQGYQVLFEAAVATPEFAPPEYHTLKRDSIQALPANWDLFSMAIVFYKIMLGIHPFAATTSGQYEKVITLGDKVKNGLYVHNDKLKNEMELVPMPHQIFYELPIAMQYLFNLCFIQGVTQKEIRPTAEDWCLALGGEQESKNKKPHYTIPKERFVLEEPIMDWQINSIFNFTFQEYIAKYLQENATGVRKIIEQNYNKNKKTIWSKFSFFSKNKTKQEQTKKTTVNPLGLGAELLPFYNKFLEEKERNFELNKGVYVFDCKMYTEKIKKIKEEWLHVRLEYEKKCIRINQEKKEKIATVLKEKKEQILWQKYPGKNALQKKQYLQQKYYTNQWTQYEKQKKIITKKIEEEQKLAWEELEKNYYIKLEKIDESIGNQKTSSERLAEKKVEEKHFLAARQKIINTIKNEKKKAEEDCLNKQDKIKKIIINYIRQLENIEKDTINQQLILERKYNQEFRKILAQLEAKMYEKEKAIKIIQKELEKSYQKTIFF